MKIDFKKLETRQDWEEALSEIIEFARKAVSAKDEDGISEATDLLNRFIETSPPERPWSSDLDDHAREALGQLLVDIATATNDDLASRTRELRRIEKAVQATVADNEQMAASIRAEKVTQALVSAMNAAKAAKDLQETVKDNAGDAKISEAAETLLAAIGEFRDVLADS